MTSKKMMRVLAALLADSKKSDRAVAMELGISQPTVSRQRVVLMERKIIKAFTLVPDLEQLGYDTIMVSTIDDIDVGTDVTTVIDKLRADNAVIGALLNVDGITVISRHKGILEVEKFKAKYVASEEVRFPARGLIKDFAITTI